MLILLGRDLGISQRWQWRILSSGMWHRVVSWICTSGLELTVEGRRETFTVKMEAVCPSSTWVHIYRTIQHHISKYNKYQISNFWGQKELLRVWKCMNQALLLDWVQQMGQTSKESPYKLIKCMCEWLSNIPVAMVTTQLEKSSFLCGIRVQTEEIVF